MLGVQVPLTVPVDSSTVPANETPSIVQTAVCVPPLSENVALRLTVVPNGYDVSDAGPMPVGTAACVSAGATTTGMDWPSPASLLPMILGIAAAVPTMRHVVHAAIRVLVMNFFIFHTPARVTRSISSSEFPTRNPYRRPRAGLGGAAAAGVSCTRCARGMRRRDLANRAGRAGCNAAARGGSLTHLVRGGASNRAGAVVRHGHGSRRARLPAPDARSQ